MPPNTLLEAVEECPNIYELAAGLNDEPNAALWGVSPDTIDFLDRPAMEVTLIVMPSTAARLEEAYREAVRHAYPYAQLFGPYDPRAQPVVIAVPDPSATTATEVLEALVNQLSVLFNLGDMMNLDWRGKLEVMSRIGGQELHSNLSHPPLAYVVDLDRAVSYPEAKVLIEALKGHVVWKHRGQVVFYASTDISHQLGLYPRTGPNYNHEGSSG